MSMGCVCRSALIKHSDIPITRQNKETGDMLLSFVDLVQLHESIRSEHCVTIELDERSLSSPEILEGSIDKRVMALAM